MEEQIKSINSSPAPDNHQSIKILPYILVIILLIIAGSIGYFLGINHISNSPTESVPLRIAGVKQRNLENPYPRKKHQIPTITPADQTQPQTSLAPADSQTPATGICNALVSLIVVTVTINPDLPSSRCIKVSANQQLQVINNTAQTIDFSLGHISFSLTPNQQHTVTQTFGSYLAPGVHDAKVSVYAQGNGPEIWLQ